MEVEKLGNIASFSQGIQVPINKQYNKPEDGYIRFLRIIDYTQNNKEIRYIDNPGEKYLVNNNDVVMIRYGDAGRVVNGYKGAIANNLFKISIDEKLIIKKYLYYYLSQESIYNQLTNRQQKTGLPAVNFKTVSDIKIVYPKNLDLQKNMVNILDKAQELINKRKEQIKALDELVKSRFIAMFGDLQANSKGWDILNFDKIATIDTNMVKDFEKYANYPHIGIDSIEKNTGRILEYQLVKDSNIKSGKYLFDERHIIYSKIRPNLNKVALPKFKGVCSADAYPILCKNGVVDRNFLGYVLRSEFFLNYILAFSGRTNIPKINKNQLKGFSMPVPPIELQNQFADFVNQVEKLKSIMGKSSKELEDNFNSLMQRVFKGELFI